MRVLIFLYGLISYVLFLPVFVYAIGFVGGIAVPKAIDDGEVGSLMTAILINAGLLTVFAVQHTIMARPAFKDRWTKVIPEAAERSTFVMVTNILFIVLYWQWRPMPDVVWSVDGVMATVILAVFAAGWAIVLLATFMIDHFDLFGMRQVTLYLQGKPYTPPRYVEHFLYRWVRHPIMLGFIIAFWAAPEMSQGRLLFAAMSTAYAVVGVHIEERDLVKVHGDGYRSYQKRVSMLLPFPKGKSAS
ncbi:MAG: protein-S-isoprenylcysteine O-methyltransferase Ste14 [Chlamydiales bacterium]|jgi:protein-S-isoprenylcysteine O-methyltransferase Ste14